MELEELDAKHRPELYKIKEIKPTRYKAKLGLKSKDGKMLQNNQDIILRWQEYVTELYADSCRREAPNQTATTVETPILQEEVETTIKNLAKGKATGEDDIPAEFLQCCGPHCIEALTSVINDIYRTGILPDDFLTSVFIPIPKVTKTKCEDFRTISLISHASKILLHLIKKRITPLIEAHLDESQFGFKKGSGTRNAIFVLRTLGERMIEKGNSLYICFIDFVKAFDRVSHCKLIQIMKEIGIPTEETNIITNLYFNQKAKVRCDNGMTDAFQMEKGVRQGCILSPILFNLYSEKLMNDALFEEGVKINGQSVKTIRYVTATSKVALQRMMDKINITCKNYGMALNAKKTKVVVISRVKEANKIEIKVDGVELEQVDQFLYLGSIINEEGRCNAEIKKRIGIAKSAFLNCKEFLR